MDERRLARKTKRENFLLEAVDLLRIVIIVVVLVYLVPIFIVRPETVVGRSMLPTLQDGDQGLTNIFTTLVFGIHRFDVVAVVEPDSGDQWVKRVIGLPNETVAYRNGVLYINDQAMEEPFLNDEYIAGTGKSRSTFTSDMAQITLGDNEYFLVGDNRPESRDSRERGPFQRSDIIGKHFYVFYPNLRIVTNDD